MASQIFDPVGSYTQFETFMYDTFTAPPLVSWAENEIIPEFVGNLPTNGSVLDVGCGGGQMPVTIRQQFPNLEVHGVDVTPEMIEKARERAQAKESDVIFRKGDALDLPYEDNTFDLVMSVGSIKHWRDRLQGLRECSRVLKEGGELHVLELNRSLTWGEYYRFLFNLRFPVVLRELFLPFFVYVVSGNGVTVDEFQEYLSELKTDPPYPLQETSASAEYEYPLVHLSARRK